MAADAEIVLKFKAEIEEALKQVKALQDALSKLNAEGGFSGEGESEKVEELQAQLSGYVAKVQELQAAYNSLKESGGEANAQALEQIKALSGELEDAQRKINGLVDKILVLQVENNKLKETVKEVGKTTATTTENSVKAYRSLRSIVGKFITDLARGKIEVQALGVALKGLAYSTVVLGAIQLAMEGINLAVQAVTESFKEDEEAARAAAEAIEESQKNVQSAIRESERAADDLAKALEKESLRRDAEAVAEQFAAQRKDAEGTLAAINEQAAAEQRMRALNARGEEREIEIQRLKLENDLISERISKEDYQRKLVKLEEQRQILQLRQKEAEAAAEEDRANAAVNELMRARAEANKAVQDAKREFERLDRPEVERQRRSNLEVASEEMNAARIKLGYATTEEEQADAMAAYEEARKAWEDAHEAWVNATDPAEYARAENKLKEAQKSFQALDSMLKNAQKAQQNAATARDTVMRQSAQDMDVNRRSAELKLANIDARQDARAREQARKAEAKDAREREKLSAEIEKLTRNAAEAAGTMGDVKDDQRAVEAVNSFLDKNADAVQRYGLDMGRLLDVAGRLRDWQTTQGSLVDRLESRLAKLEQDVKSGAQRAKNQAKNS